MKQQPKEVERTIYHPLMPRGHGSRRGTLPNTVREGSFEDKRRHVHCVQGCKPGMDGKVMHRDRTGA